jgi:Ca2+/Na+ antiporter
MDPHSLLAASSAGPSALTWVVLTGSLLACAAVVTGAAIVVRRSRWEREPHYRRHTPTPPDPD